MTEETKGTVTGRHGKKSPAWLYTAPGMFPYVEVEVLNGRVRADPRLQDTFEPLTPDLSAYRVLAREGGDFVIMHMPTQETLLITQSVSIETLVRIATERTEGKR